MRHYKKLAFISMLFATLSLTACSSMSHSNKRLTGTAVGAVAGGIIGDAMFGGPVGTIAGAAAGGVAGNVIGGKM